MIKKLFTLVTVPLQRRRLRRALAENAKLKVEAEMFGQSLKRELGGNTIGQLRKLAKRRPELREVIKVELRRREGKLAAHFN